MTEHNSAIIIGETIEFVYQCLTINLTAITTSVKKVFYSFKKPASPDQRKVTQCELLEFCNIAEQTFKFWDTLKETKNYANLFG